MRLKTVGYVTFRYKTCDCNVLVWKLNRPARGPLVTECSLQATFTTEHTVVRTDTTGVLNAVCYESSLNFSYFALF